MEADMMGSGSEKAWAEEGDALDFRNIPYGIRELVDLIWDYLEQQGGFVIDPQREVKLAGKGAREPKTTIRELVVNLTNQLKAMDERQFALVQRYVAAKHEDTTEERAAG